MALYLPTYALKPLTHTHENKRFIAGRAHSQITLKHVHTYENDDDDVVKRRMGMKMPVILGVDVMCEENIVCIYC